MNRFLCLTVASLLTATAVAADEIKPNVPFEGKFPKTPEEAGGPKGPRAKAHRASVEVTLEAGHKPTVAVTAAGEGRKVALTVLDKAGTPVATSLTVRKAQGPAALHNWKDAGLSQYTMSAGGFGSDRLTASAKVEVPAVPVKGTYTIVIFSNYEGEFTLTVTDPKAK